jgi:hypothetical protein
MQDMYSPPVISLIVGMEKYFDPYGYTMIMKFMSTILEVSDIAPRRRTWFGNFVGFINDGRLF